MIDDTSLRHMRDVRAILDLKNQEFTCQPLFSFQHFFILQRNCFLFLSMWIKLNS